MLNPAKSMRDRPFFLHTAPTVAWWISLLKFNVNLHNMMFGSVYYANRNLFWSAILLPKKISVSRHQFLGARSEPNLQLAGVINYCR